MDVKKAELATAVAAAQQGSSSPPEAAPADDTLADKVSAMERKASSLAEQLHYKVGMVSACDCSIGSADNGLPGFVP